MEQLRQQNAEERSLNELLGPENILLELDLEKRKKEKIKLLKI